MAGHMNRNDNSLMSQFLPAECVVLWIILAIAIPLTIAEIASIGEPILAWLEGFMSSFNPEMLETEFSLPHIPMSIIILSTIGIIISLGLFVTIQAKYINNWYSAADKKKLYTQPRTGDSITSLTLWVIYRSFYILFPVILMGIITLALAFLSIKFFNLIAKMMGANLELVITLGIFTALTVGFFWVIAIGFTAWNTLTTVYGSIISVVEPDISKTFIRKRSRRFAFLTSSSWGAYIAYLFLMGVYFLEFAYLVLNSSFISFSNIHIIGIIQIINIALFIALGRSLTFSYYKSLLIQYAKISVKKSKILSSQNDLPSSSTDNFTVSLI